MMNKLVKGEKELIQKELTDKELDQINFYAQKGNDEIDAENYEHAIGCFKKALDVIPTPQEHWEATGWLSASIGDAYFYLKEYDKGLVNLHRAYDIYGTKDANPFVLLRLGQCYFHLGNEDHAKNYLYKAYLMEGEDLFFDEQLYFDFLKSKHQL